MADATVTVSLPDVITMGVWNAYCEGDQAYRKREKDAGRADNNMSALFFSAQAVIKKGYVHIKAPDQFMEYVNSADIEAVPAAVVGLLVRLVCRPIEKAFDEETPFVSTPSGNGSSPTT